MHECLFVCVYLHARVRCLSRVNVYVYVYVVCLCVCVCVCACACVRVCLREYIYMYIFICMSAYISNAYICINVYQYVCIYAYMYTRPKKMYGERLGDGVEYHLMDIYHLRRGVGFMKFLENGSRPQPPTSMIYPHHISIPPPLLLPNRYEELEGIDPEIL